MNILFVIDCLNLGGAQTFLLRLVRALAPNHNIIIYVLYPNERDKQLEQSFLNGLNVKIVSVFTYTKISNWLVGKVGNALYRLGYKTFRKDITDRLIVNRLKFIILSEKINVINSHLFASDWMVFQIIKNTNIRWFVSMHGCYETFLHGGYYEKFKLDYIDHDFIEKSECVFKRANGIILASDKNKKINSYLSQETVNNVKQKKIYYGFQPNHFVKKERSEYNIPGDRLIFGMVARGIKEKGWKFLLNSFMGLINEGFSNIHLILVCDRTPYIDGLKEEYTHDNILFTGPSYSPLEWVHLMDVTILPTYFSGESLPNSVIEYLYANKPVIACNTGDISTMVSDQDEKAGFLIPLTESNRPDQEALTSAMRAYILDPNLKIKHGEIAKAAFQKFDMNYCVESYLNFFQDK
ncbi:hypothetical protein GCM10027275_30150 [Rhabdobacter roseus]|uniref:Glycosyltransferase involved in cell wall biosynthesis n=1 Tax=Rhabdobacter roseus TaxID=1655419 RepID=A0A840TTU3_9BACT|nr:glycosyltransferase family 4 protein [Rhabdobacter roseus]MBB5284972.1 glycosyltransferase involved in cell wall biosynthesis [Rhabdobacter roseus]